MIKEFFSMIGDSAHKNFSLKKANGDRRMVVMIIASTMCLLPFAIFKSWFESVAEDSSIFAEGVCFLYTAAILYLSTKCMNGRKKAENITGKDSLIVGLFQGVALLPGVSRLGSTISAGLFCGFTRSTAVEYSFILGIPAILAGCFSELIKALKSSDAIQWGNCIVGFIVAAAVGLGAIKLINWLVKSDKFRIFAYYTLILGGVVLLISIIEAIKGSPISFA
jgi:undecaprenyl-diphosphatase